MDEISTELREKLESFLDSDVWNYLHDLMMNELYYLGETLVDPTNSLENIRFMQGQIAAIRKIRHQVLVDAGEVISEQERESQGA